MAKNYEKPRVRALEEDRPTIEQEEVGLLTRLTHEREVDVQAAFVIDKGGIADAVGLNPIADVLTKLVVSRLCAVELI